MNENRPECPGRIKLGMVTVEFAIVAPVFFMFVFAGIEFSRANMIRNSVQNAVYEGARTGIVPGATNAECVAATQSLLDIVGIQQSTIVVTPSNLDNATTISVSVTAPLDGANGYVFPNFFLGRTISSSITLEREF